MLKKVVVLFLSFVFIIFSVIIPDLRSFATVVIPVDDNTHYYLYNHFDIDNWDIIDFLTVDNYNNLYDELNGNLKTNVENIFYPSNSSSILESLLLGNYNVETNYLNASQLYFTPVVYNGNTIDYEECTHMVGYSSSNDQFYLMTIYSPTGKNVVNASWNLVSEDPFYFTYTYYSTQNLDINGDVYTEFLYGGNLSQQSTVYNNYNLKELAGNYYTIIYDDIVLFNGNSNYIQYNSWYSSFTGFLNGDEFCVDRRTNEFIDKINGGQNVSSSNYGFKQGSFHNAVYGSTFNDQKLFVAYELNDASKTIKNDLYLKLDYIFDMDGIFVNNEFDYSAQFSNINGSYDLYSLSDSNYINVSLDSVFDKMNVLYRDNRTLVEQYRNIYNYFNPASDGWVASPSQVNPNDAFGILYKNGLLSVSPVSINYSEQFLNSLSVNYKEISFGIGINANAISNEGGNLPRINRLDSCFITIIESVYNVVTGDESNVFMYTYNYITKEVQEVGTLENGNEVFNGYTNGSQSSLNNPNSDNMNYNTSSGQYLPSNAYGGSSNASVGDIIINTGVGSIPYILVDIPENEWMSKTPNLSSILNDFKSMLAETKEDSVLTMLPQTYNYFPAPVMQYLLYGVGLIVMIGIWRAITRR